MTTNDLLMASDSELMSVLVLLNMNLLLIPTASSDLCNKISWSTLSNVLLCFIYPWSQITQLVKLQESLKDITTCVTSNFLLLNSYNIEAIVLSWGYCNLRNMLSNQIFTLNGISLASSNTEESWSCFDLNISFNGHIKQIYRTAFFHLRNIFKIRNIIS